MMEQINTVIKEADLVLVGIGEEADTALTILQTVQPYSGYMEILKEEQEEKWLVSYLFSHFLTHTEDQRRNRAYKRLAELLRDKNYFIVTTCMDGRIKESLLRTERIVAPCGDYDTLQCSSGCANNLSEAGSIVEEVWQELTIKKVQPRQIKRPVCPICGQHFLFNHIQEEYLEEGYLPQWEYYTKWLQGTVNKKLCILELGVGLAYPTVIRWPFEKVAFFNQKASFFRVHGRLYQLSKELADRGVAIKEDSLDFMENKL